MASQHYRPYVYFIVTGYNCSSFLEDTFKSILCQTLDDWHVIFVDDASTDNTLAIAKKNQERLPSHFTVLSNEYRSYKAAGFIKAMSIIPDGTIVAELDGDDSLVRNTAVAELISLHKLYDMVYTAHSTQNTSNRDWEVWQSTLLPRNWSRKFPNRDEIWSPQYFPGHLRTFKSHLFKLIDPSSFYYKGKPLKVAFDLVYYTSLLEIVPSELIYFYDEICYQYYVRPHNDQFIEDDMKTKIANYEECFCQTVIDKWFKSLDVYERLSIQAYHNQVYTLLNKPKKQL